jgi:hypothetical protein
MWHEDACSPFKSMDSKPFGDGSKLECEYKVRDPVHLNSDNFSPAAKPLPLHGCVLRKFYLHHDLAGVYATSSILFPSPDPGPFAMGLYLIHLISSLTLRNSAIPGSFMSKTPSPSDMQGSQTRGLTKAISLTSTHHPPISNIYSSFTIITDANTCDDAEGVRIALSLTYVSRT